MKHRLMVTTILLALTAMLVTPCAQADTGEGTFLSFVLDTTGYQPSAVTIAPQQAWDAAGKTLSLSATARDSQAGAVTTAQSFTWALLSSDGSQQLASGAMTWSADDGQWLASQVISGGLTAGNYTVQYSLTTSQGQTGAASGTLALTGQYSLGGKVLDGKTLQPLQGVQISVGGQTTPTDGNGKYSFSSVDPAGAATLSASLSGYAAYNAPLNPPSAGKQIVQDFKLFPCHGQARGDGAEAEI